LVVAGGLDLDAVIDRGTGIDDDALERKREIVARAVAARGPFKDAHHIMRAVGGLEFATMTGFILGLKGAGIGCMIDGFPVSAAAYTAWLIDPEVTGYLFAGHLSKVKGHRVILDAMGLRPLISLDMRLGEGTGAVIGGFLVYLASMFPREMATFDSSHVSRSDRDEKDY
jgi:nicotinate-nucleotide--dimethylbenzimidazole phosphoribosyltransferase